MKSNELLCYLKQKYPTSTGRTVISKEDIVRRQNYLKKIEGKSNDGKREFRAARDARYLHNKPQTSDEKDFCFDHLTGRCNNQCGRWHQMRHLRLFGVCKFYIIGACSNGDSCIYMHEEFPCRFYYLDLQHPQLEPGEVCRFKHGGPLPERLCRYFKRQIEIWVKKTYENKPEQIHDQLANLLHKFDTKQVRLAQQLNKNNKESSIEQNSVSLTGAETEFSGLLSIGSILSTKAINKLKELNITTLNQINQTPVDRLLDYGLTMDQIYEITIKSSHENQEGATNSPEHGSCDEMPIDDSTQDLSILNDVEFDLDENSLEGFTDDELEDSMELLEIKRCVFYEQNSCVTIDVTMENKEFDTSKSDFRDDKLSTKISQTEPNASDESDNEDKLIISED